MNLVKCSVLHIHKWLRICMGHQYSGNQVMTIEKFPTSSQKKKQINKPLKKLPRKKKKKQAL